MVYPSTILNNTNPSGSDPLTSPDHASLHSTVNTDLTAVESKVGLGAGTPTANTFLYGSGNGTSTWSSAGTGLTLVNSTFNNGTLGTALIVGGTINSAVMGTPTVTGGVINNATLGSPTVTGGTSTATHSVTRTIGSAAYSGTAGGTTTLNLATATRHLVNMPNSAGALTLALSNVSANQPFLVEIMQGTAGLGTITWFTTIRWAGSVAPSQTFTASRKDTFGFMPTSTNTFDGYIVGQDV